jgi:hypothetical protein
MRMFVSTGDKVIYNWIKLHNEKYHIFYSYICTTWVMEDQIPRSTKKNNACENLLGKPEWKTSLGRPSSKWKYIIKADCKERQLENTD